MYRFCSRAKIQSRFGIFYQGPFTVPKTFHVRRRFDSVLSLFDNLFHLF